MKWQADLWRVSATCLLVLATSCKRDTGEESGAAPSSAEEASADPTIQEGQRRADVESILGPPAGVMRVGKETILSYPRGTVTLMDEKVVLVALIGQAAFDEREAQAAARAAEVAEKNSVAAKGTTDTARDKSNWMERLLSKSGKNAAISRDSSAPDTEPDVASSSTTPPSFSGLSLIEKMPDASTIRTGVQRLCREHNVDASDSDIAAEIDRYWQSVSHPRSNSFLSQWHFDMSTFNMQVLDEKLADGDHVRLTYRVGSAGKWQYVSSLPKDRTGGVEVWKRVKRTHGTKTNNTGTHIVTTSGGSYTRWYKLTWDASRGRWSWRSKTERDVYERMYEKELRQIMAERRKLENTAKKIYSKNPSLSSLVRAYKSAFEYRYLKTFIAEFRNVPWLEP